MIKKYRVRVDGREYNVEVEGERKITGRREAQKAPTEKEKMVCAPMPARVVKINCRAGEGVKKGDLLMIIEAMKMENEILSPTDGVVKEVCVVEEANVSNEERLVVFE